MLHILLVDDDEDEHLFFRWSLEKLDAQVQLLDAYSAAQAECIIRKTKPDLIFLDINLPGADGFECLESIRANTALNKVPVYMFSTEISDKTIQRAGLLGATGCVKKCRGNDSLTRTLLNLLNIRSPV